MTIQQMLLATSSGGGTVTLANAGNVNGNPQQQEITISNFISAGGTLIIPSGLYVWSDDTSTPALTVDISCTIINQGNIMGRGGNGGNGDFSSRVGADGGPAIKINSGVSGVVITNEAGGNIFGGGGGGNGGKASFHTIAKVGGGGGGAGGGNGGNGRNSSNNGGSGGDIGNAGSWASGGSLRGRGGDHGGSGASSDGLGSPSSIGDGGGGGGRKITGNQRSAATGYNATYGTGGGYGGNNNNAGGNTSGGVFYKTTAGSGGGGYGASGGLVTLVDSTPSNGGKAIDDSGVTYTLTNNGTIYGGT